MVFCGCKLLALEHFYEFVNLNKASISRSTDFACLTTTLILLFFLVRDCLDFVVPDWYQYGIDGHLLLDSFTLIQIDILACFNLAFAVAEAGAAGICAGSHFYFILFIWFFYFQFIFSYFGF